MTLDKVVKILNERNHRDCSKWWLHEYANGTSFVCGEDRYDCLEAFEAVAVAEKYLRESEPSASNLDDLYYSTDTTRTTETFELWRTPAEAAVARSLRRPYPIDALGGKHA